MPVETCLKCGHANPSATGSETEACPQCGAIYARVKAAMARGQTVRPAKAADSGFSNLVPPPDTTPKKHAPARAVAEAIHAHGPYVNQLRERTNYPTFRTVVRLGLYFGYLLAFAALVGGAVTAFRSGGSLVNLLIGAGAGAALYLLTRIWFELTVMIVDIADASVRTAENSEAAGAG